MNTIKTLLLGASALVLTQAVSAQTVIRIAGSNGDRNATNAAIANLLQGETFVAIVVKGSPGTPTTSNFSNFVGGTFNGTAVTVKTAFIGATGGIKAVAGSQTVRFLPTSATGTSNADPSTSTTPSQYEDAVPNFAVSTNYQSTSPYIGQYLGQSYIELQDTITGVIALNFLGSKNFPGDNLTTAQAQALYSRGGIPLAFMTGSSADRNKTVFAIGRNTDAGQRYGALAEFGLGVNAGVQQFQPTISSGVVTSHTLWPRETISGVDSGDAGNSGFRTGSDLVAGLVVTLGPNAYHVYNSNATAGYYVGYLTPSDASTAIAGGAVLLKWNGIPYSAAAVQEGQYTAWLYTHVLYDPNLAGLARTLADAVAGEVSANTIVSPGGGILFSSMQVNRNAEGASVSANYF